MYLVAAKRGANFFFIKLHLSRFGPSGFLWKNCKMFSKLMTIMTVCSGRRTFICNSMPSQRLSCLSKVRRATDPHGLFHIIRWIRCMWNILFHTFAHTKTLCNCVSKNLGAQSYSRAQPATRNLFSFSHARKSGFG